MIASSSDIHLRPRQVVRQSWRRSRCGLPAILVLLSWIAISPLMSCDQPKPGPVGIARANGSVPIAAAPIVSGTKPATAILAAIQFTGQDGSQVHSQCKAQDNLCAIAALIRQAAGRGAQLVVTPEYALGLDVPAVEPELGARPSTASHPRADDPVAVLSGLAHELRIYLVAAMQTSAGRQHDAPRHNTQIAFGPDGSVVGKHHKIVLYAGERAHLRAGTDVTAFDTPFGRVGMLICADLYGDQRMHDRLTGELGATIVALSTMWTVDESTRWQSAFARDWGVVLVASNGSSGAGAGGGIFGPDGKPLAKQTTGDLAITLATVPAR